jgi:membrane-associated protease RseP (regulator of RpoE activity)
MNRITRITHPVVVLALICAFIYIYFVYLKGGVPPSLTAPSAETEKAWDGVSPEAPGMAAWAGPAAQQQNPINQPNQQMAGPVVQQQNPINQPNQQNLVQPPNQLTAPRGNPDSILPAQPNQNAPVQQPIAASDKALIEGHWIGGEVIPLTAMIAKANSIPPDVVGVLIDEVTLLSAEGGLYAGDVITAINGKKVSDLKSFQQATKEVAQSNRANLSVYSGGKNKDIMIFSTEVLGMAQMEGAPMIMAADRSPHGYYGPCDRCHVISKNAGRTKTTLNSKNALNPSELLKDAGDSLTKVAPNIRRGVPPPHRSRGTCTLCHVVL